jgi:glycerate kinase
MLGPNAASRKFTVQKGGSTRTMHKLEENLALLAQCVQNEGIKATGFEPGSGAAGGLGYGVLALQGSLVPGAAKLLALIGFTEMLQGVDLVLTGEGSYDEQTADGKLINALAEACQHASVPLVVLAGVAKPIDIKGVTAAFSINLPGKRKQDNLDDTKQNLKHHAASVVKVAAART